jgi:hypothetical protein
MSPLLPPRDDPARKMAVDALRESIAKLLESGQYPDEHLESLPEDFSERLMGIAWERRDDVETTAFVRDVNRYMREIVPDPGGES